MKYIYSINYIKRENKMVKKAFTVRRRRKAFNATPAQLVVPTFLSMVNTVKMYHWRTSQFSVHKATDQLFSSLNDKVDDFVEVMLGKPVAGGSGAGSSRDKYLNLPNEMLPVPIVLDAAGFTAFLEQKKVFLTTDLNALFDAVKDSDLLAIRDDILAAVNQYLYLQTFH